MSEMNPGRRNWLRAAGAVVMAAGLPGTAALAAAPGYRVFVTNERSGTLSVIDGATRKVTVTVPLGKRPRGLKASPDRKLIYVALSGSPIAGPGVDPASLPAADKGADGIGVVDVATLRLTRILRGVSDPEQLAVSGDGKRLIVASEDTGRGIIMDAADGKVIASLPVGGEPEGVTISPDGRFVYMSSEEDHSIAVIDVAAARVVKTFEVGLRPRFTEFSADGHWAFVSGENDGTITVVDVATHTPQRRFKLEGEMKRPVGMAATRDGRILYVATGRGMTLLAVDPATGRTLRSVQVGPRPWGVALSPDEKTLYTANGTSNDVSVVDAATFRIEPKVAVGDSPWGLIIL